MRYEQIKAYIESAEIKVVLEDGKKPFRRVLVKKGNVGDEIYESNFVQMDEETQEIFLADLVKGINEMYQMLEDNKQKKKASLQQPHKEIDFGPDVGRERIWSMSDEEYNKLYPTEKNDRRKLE